VPPRRRNFFFASQLRRGSLSLTRRLRQTFPANAVGVPYRPPSRLVFASQQSFPDAFVGVAEAVWCGDPPSTLPSRLVTSTPAVEIFAPAHKVLQNPPRIRMVSPPRFCRPPLRVLKTHLFFPSFPRGNFISLVLEITSPPWGAKMFKIRAHLADGCIGFWSEKVRSSAGFYQLQGEILGVLKAFPKKFIPTRRGRALEGSHHRTHI